MKKKRIALLVTLLSVAACGTAESPPAVNSTGNPAPGEGIDLNALIGAAPGVYTWALGAVPGAPGEAALAGLSLVGSVLTMPDCRWSGAPSFGSWPFCVPLTATQNAVPVLTLTVCADERLIASKIACALATGDVLCRDPAGPITVEVGQTVTFYSLVAATCTRSYTPPLPAGACPATDPAFAFCR